MNGKGRGWPLASPPLLFSRQAAMAVRINNQLDQDTWQRLCRARRLMDQHYRQPLRLDRLAQQACFSRFHFLRLFRHYFGKTPHQYLIETRIRRAKELLDASRLPVTDVCYEVGFESLGSFSSLFRKVVGVSPRNYRTRFEQPRPLSTPAEHAAIPACFLLKFGNLPAAAR